MQISNIMLPQVACFGCSIGGLRCANPPYGLIQIDWATTASREWNINLVTAYREEMLMFGAGIVSRPWRYVAKVILASFVIPLTIAARADDLPPNIVELGVGETKAMLDDSLLLGVGGVAKSLLGARRKFDISVGSSAQIALPTQVLASFSPPCEAIPSILMIHGSLPSRAGNPLF
jgi:hypothetical protein